MFTLFIIIIGLGFLIYKREAVKDFINKKLNGW